MSEMSEVREAAAVLGRGGLVAFPTETVYGLGADAESPEAVRRIFEVKGRPHGHPLIIHLPRAAVLDDWADEVPAIARELAREAWPGPLTLILRRSARVSDVVTGGLPTVGLRVPSHPLALALLEEFGGGVAAPSANRYGSVSPTTAAHVRDELGDRIDQVLDGGPCDVGVESTIVDLSGNEPSILRPGGLPREEIERMLGRPVPVTDGGAVRAPGQPLSHYSPRAEVHLVGPGELAARSSVLAQSGRSVAVLAAERPVGMGDEVRFIQVPSASPQLARELYRALREADARGVAAVVTSLPEETGLGLAIADRLRRASRARGGAEPRG